MKKTLVLLLIAGTMCARTCSPAAVRTDTSVGATAATDDGAAPSVRRTPLKRTANPSNTLRVAFVPVQGARGDNNRHRAAQAAAHRRARKASAMTSSEVDITVGTSYEAVGEALSAGTADVGLIPRRHLCISTMTAATLLLTATRDGLSIDSDSAKDWNDNAPTEPTTEPSYQLPRADDRRPVREGYRRSPPRSTPARSSPGRM